MYLAIAGRLVDVQFYRNDRYKKWASHIRFRDISLPASRGAIYDRTGRPMAVSIETASVYANRNEVRDPSATAARVAALLGPGFHIPESKFEGSSSIVWLGRQLDPRVCERVAKVSSELPGVGVQRDTKRVYPAGMLAAHILGFANFYGKGIEGLEHTLDSVLSGKDGLDRGELDARRRVIPETRREVRKPEDGKDVYLTIDTTIQHIAEQAVARMAEQFKPHSAQAIVMDPQTGEILALVNYPAYDPNRPKAVESSVWRNRAVADLYEPGSTLKTVTVAAALEEGVSQYEVVAHCTGHESINKGRIRCSLHHPFMSGHGPVDMYRLIQQSCNIGAAHLAYKLGPKKLYSYEKAFGLLDKIDAGFGCEVAGRTIPPENWQPMRLANIGFGQGIAVTPLQMASVYATIANGGVYVEPQIIREIRNPDGSVYKPFEVKNARRVVSRANAHIMSKLLVSCVLEGTGKTAKVPGRLAAGKTGSAQVPKPKGGYESGAFIASFMGFVPAYNPRLVIAVVVNRPKGSHWGATVAAPVFREIGEKALWYLKVPADNPPEPDEKPEKQADRKRLA